MLITLLTQATMQKLKCIQTPQTTLFRRAISGVSVKIVTNAYTCQKYEIPKRMQRFVFEFMESQMRTEQSECV